MQARSKVMTVAGPFACSLVALWVDGETLNLSYLILHQCNESSRWALSHQSPTLMRRKETTVRIKSISRILSSWCKSSDDVESNEPDLRTVPRVKPGECDGGPVKGGITFASVCLVWARGLELQLRNSRGSRAAGARP